ncbi:hypothetical protein BTN49_1058 [Candidatus Enterovibrio escicola]|uniref:Uncharacterized protein n=1 Tax=Candidatus Enterovibrio escicola TaxID=1927127 RepID=A0A2A5T4I9_9GAMM|nr:hypothetical protein BTN49_1058 [Candidatus Enterovibrio escacola]
MEKATDDAPLIGSSLSLHVSIDQPARSMGMPAILFICSYVI